MDAAMIHSGTVIPHLLAADFTRLRSVAVKRTDTISLRRLDAGNEGRPSLCAMDEVYQEETLFLLTKSIS